MDTKKCRYCRAERPVSEMIEVKIRENREWAYYWFCKGKPCAGYYQMGCEG